MRLNPICQVYMHIAPPRLCTQKLRSAYSILRSDASNNCIASGCRKHSAVVCLLHRTLLHRTLVHALSAHGGPNKEPSARGCAEKAWPRKKQGGMLCLGSGYFGPTSTSFSSKSGSWKRTRTVSRSFPWSRTDFDLANGVVLTNYALANLAGDDIRFH